MNNEINKREIKVIQTAKETKDRLTQKDTVHFHNENPELERALINIYQEITYQEIEGFGGAFTEAASVTLDKLSPNRRREIIDAYFSVDKGIGYSFCRTHINSCDFSLGNYSYVAEGDEELATFNIDRDRQSLIPLIKDAVRVRGEGLKILASPWSPPAFMKTNGRMNHGGKLKEKYRQAWATYFAKYIKEYAKEGIDIYMVSVQNEPKAIQRWDSCIYTAEEERDFVKSYLGPTLEAEGLGAVKITIWDHNKERVFERANIPLSDPDTAKYIWGVGFHWYSGDHFESLDAVHQKFPDKKLIFTEGCVEGGQNMGSWSTGEAYGHDIIGNLNNHTAAFIDWNIALDEIGGPNHVGNYCDAPVIVDTRKDSYVFESSYYYIGHFSKFIRPGAKRICSSKYTDQLEVTAFKNTDGSVAVVVMNRTDAEVHFNLREDYGMAKFVSLPHSIMTLVY